MAPQPTIGRLRWPVTVARRAQDPEEGGSGITEAFVDCVRTHADIMALGPVAFYAAAAVDNGPVTHSVTLRWQDELDTRHVILRDTRRRDGSIRREVFRVRRTMEIDGRKRWVRVEAELEFADKGHPPAGAYADDGPAIAGLEI